MELRADERVLFQGRPSWRALMTFYVAGTALAAVIFVVVGILGDKLGIAVAIAAVIVVLTLLIGFLRRVGTRYLLTTQRLRISRGIVRKDVQETRLDRVEQKVDALGGAFDRFRRELPKIVAETVREVLRERDARS